MSQAPRVAWLAIAAGCAHSATSPATKPARTVMVPIMEAHGHHEPERGFVTDAVARTMLPCTVSDERALGTATARRIACTPAYDVIDGVWAVGPAGLYKLAAMPASANDLTADDLVLAAAPQASHHGTADDHPENTEVDNVDERFAYHGGWCVRSTHGDELARTDDTRCFDANGPTSGRRLEIAGPDQAWRESTYGAPPADDFDPMRS